MYVWLTVHIAVSQADYQSDRLGNSFVENLDEPESAHWVDLKQVCLVDLFYKVELLVHFAEPKLDQLRVSYFDGH